VFNKKVTKRLHDLLDIDLFDIYIVGCYVTATKELEFCKGHSWRHYRKRFCFALIVGTVNYL